MDKKDMHQAEQEEKTLDFETAKELTVGEAVKKHKEIQAGVTEDDGLLDRYIKQHRDEIEAKKFETKMVNLPALEELSKADIKPSGEVATSLTSELISETEVGEVSEFTLIEETTAYDEFLSEGSTEQAREDLTENEVLPDPEKAVFNDFESFEEDDEKERKKKVIIWTGLVALFVAVLSGVFVLMNGTDKNQSSTESSSSSSQTASTSSSSSSKIDANLTAFNKLYATFFVDAEQAKLKNSKFGKLSDLKALLDKMDTSSTAYKTAKAKYDTLEKAIKAIQTLNYQFDKELIVNGELDTTATVKSDASFTASTTGLSSVDALLTSAITFGQSQQTVATTTAQAAADTSSGAGTTTTTASVSISGTTTAVTGGTSSVGVGDNPLYGIAAPAGVTLQRNLSRVPYDQSKIDDVNNPAWTFNEGVLEQIISISQQRGYVMGNNYILEKVNIVNGNGYYNLFKPDGTYLFSINCKTGYFVGNGSGYADALDF